MRMTLKMDTKMVKTETILAKQKEVLFRAMVVMENLARKFSPKAFGQLKSNIHLIPDQPGHSTYRLVDGVNYGVFVEKGAKAHFVPIEPLKDWAQLKLGDANAAYAVRNKIAAEGTKAQPFFMPAKIETENIWIPIIWRQVHGLA